MSHFALINHKMVEVGSDLVAINDAFHYAKGDICLLMDVSSDGRVILWNKASKWVIDAPREDFRVLTERISDFKRCTQ